MSDASIVPCPNHLVMWAGTVTPQELDCYMAETHPLGPGGPRTFFAAEIMYWYDPDYVEYFASEGPSGLEQAMKLRGITDEELIREALRRCPDSDRVSAFVILWNYTASSDGPIRS